MTENTTAPPLSWDDWGRRDGLALAELVRRGELSARDVIGQAAAAARRVDPQLEALVELFDDVVENPDVDRPSHGGALYGVPFFLKDLGSRLAGRQRASGSALYAGYRAEETDPFVANALAAGLIPLGRATTPEFGLTFDTSTRYRGRVVATRNPWNLQRTAGGSSGGSASLVAAGVTPISMSSDGGGSTRLPAGFCGLVGLKVTRGLVPPVIGGSQLLSRYGVEGVVTRTVRDSAAAYDYLTRIPNGGTFIPVRPAPGTYLDALKERPGRLRVAFSTGTWGFDTPAHPEVAARTREVAAQLEGLGHAVEEVADSAICDFGRLRKTFRTGWQSGSAIYLRECAARGVDPGEVLCPMTRKYAERAQSFDRWALHQTWLDNAAVTREFGRFFETYDLLLAPLIPMPVPAADGPYSLLRDEEFDPFFERLHEGVRYTSPANETGLPAIALPAGLDSEGVPLSVQLYGNFLGEAGLLQVAATLEAAKPDWFNQTPPHHISRVA